MESITNILMDKGKNILNLKDNLKTLKAKLKRLSFRKADIEEQVTKAEETGKKKRKREVENWFKEVEKTKRKINALKNKIKVRGFWGNRDSGDRVAKFEAKVDQLLEQSQHFDGLVIDDLENKGEPRVTTELFGDKFQEGLKAILNWLLTDNLSNIGIYGQGGVGKTTLAKHIHNHLLEKTDFNVYWVTVSQEFSIKKLQEDIAKHVNLVLSGEDDEDQRAARLSRSLADKQPVLILDDVWEEFCPEKIGIDLGADKCRLILTTRSLQVCHRMLCQREFDVKTLDADETWNLFKHTLGLKTALTPEVEETAKKVAKRCAGLPLGIITVAGSMRGVVDIYEWRNALKQLESSSIGYKEMEDKVFPILEWSFNRLNRCERPCFLYCCLYPEDKKIEREELINLFILAELIPRSDNRESEHDHGRTILNKLVKVCLLEETQDFHKQECVKMHDLIRDMALRITGRNSRREMKGDVPRIESNVVIVEESEWTEDLNAVSFSRYPYLEIPLEMSPNCQNLSTLLFQGSEIEKIPDLFFSHMNGLKVLNLRHCRNLKELPNCVSNLVNLTALLLGGCKEIKSVPPLGKLKQLRELDLSNTEMDDIPQGLELLFKLESLNLRHCSRLKELPNYVSNLVNLTALLLGHCREIKSVPPLGKLKKLRELDLFDTKMDDIPQGLELLFKLECLNMGETELKKKIIPKGTFSKLNRLQHLVMPPWVQFCDLQVLKQLKVFRGGLSWMDVYNEFITSGCWPKHYAISVVEEETPFRPLYCLGGLGPDYGKELDFGECKSQKGLDVVLIPEDINKLIVSKCFRLSDGNLHNLIRRSKDLVCLHIKDSEEVEFLFNFSSPSPSHVDDDKHQLVVLPNLKELWLDNLPNFVGLINWGRQQQLIPPPPGTFSSLTFLTIKRCHRLKKLFTVQLLSQHHTLQNLQTLQIIDCEQVEEMIAANDNDERMGEEIVIHPSSSSSSSASSTVRLPKLQTLNLCNLPQLENKAISITSDSIIEILVSRCPKLKRLPLYIPINNINTTNANAGNGQTSSSSAPPPPQTLQLIRGSKEWWESLEWNHYPPNFKDVLLPFYKSWFQRR